MLRVRAVGLACVLAAGCLPDNPDDDPSAGSDDTGDDDDDDDDDDPGAGGDFLGCPEGERCTLVLVSHTLDDRLEVFSPGDPSGNEFRGAVDLDYKPNVCEGCQPGDYADGRLDEPFGLTRAGGFLHVAVGHYPARDSGSLVSFPLSFFDSRAAGSTVSVSEYFAGNMFQDPVIDNSLEEIEPIFVTRLGGRLLIGTFNNDLFATEDNWTVPGKLLVLDASDPGGTPAEIDLADVGGEPCNGASSVVSISEASVAVACDGNEAVAVLDGTALRDLPLDELDGGVDGTLCKVPGAIDNRRVRYVAPDGGGGFIVGEGPTPLDVLSAARLWHFGGDCSMEAFAQLPAEGDWQLAELERVPTADDTWLLASGGATAMPNRGVYVVRSSDGEIEVCGSLDGFDSHWDTPDGPIDPFALAMTADGSGLAVGAGPFQAPLSGPGYGKVLWADLSGASDPCSMTASVTDLTAGGDGAPAVDPENPLTYRRAPNVVEVVELEG